MKLGLTKLVKEDTERDDSKKGISRAIARLDKDE